ncbi:LacI family DNA-binding transcriptional regulator [Halanaerocella petrolearia]
MKVTIQDVANEAGVAPSTVSRVFNNKGSISSQTKEEVFKAAEKLGYKVKTKKSTSDENKNIGIIFNTNLLGDLRSNTFYNQVMEGVEEILKEYNYHLVFKTINEAEEDNWENIKKLINNSDTKGVILAGYEIDKDIILKIKETAIPMVLVDNNLWNENIDCVVNDDFFGSKRIVNHLIKSGHKKIGFIGGPLTHDSLAKRYKGYKEALQEAEIELNSKWNIFCEPSFEVQDGYQAAKDILTKQKEIPTAFTAANDKLAIGVIKASQELGYTIPEDIAIVGFDDIEMSQYTMPSLTTVRIFKREMGIEAGKRLIDLINGVSSKPIKIVVSVESIIRDSTK